MFIVSDLIHNFFLVNFNIYHFQKQNEYIIREYYIKNYVETTPRDSLYSDIKYMLLTMNISTKIHIHADFPRETLVKIMQPYLLLYYQSIYSVDLYKRNSCSHELLMRLVKFINYNPKFGRKHVKFHKQIRTLSLQDSLRFKPYRRVFKKIVSFNVDHLPFYSKDHFFMTTQSNIDDYESSESDDYQESTDSE